MREIRTSGLSRGRVMPSLLYRMTMFCFQIRRVSMPEMAADSRSYFSR